MKPAKIAFIGGGNMARGLIGGMLADNFPASNIWVSDPDIAQANTLQQLYPGIHITADNIEAVGNTDTLVLAVKPQTLKSVALELASAVQTGQQLVISIAAGIRSIDLERWLGGDVSVVRCMPNTPALVSSAATGLYANARVNPAQHDFAESILRAVGLTVWVANEELIDAVTAVSGSGPAYFFLVMEALEQAGVKLGLETEVARLLSIQTAFGAAKLALESDETPAILRQRVTSKGGTTERAIDVLSKGNLLQLFADALSAASQRAQQMADDYGADNTETNT